MKKLFFSIMLCIPLFAAVKQTVSSAQWIAEYKGNGTLKLFEGKKMGRDEEFTSGVFSHYKYKIFPCTSDYWGVNQPCALFLIENSDEKGRLKIKPKKNIGNLTQPIQIVGSNSHFKLIKVLVKKDTDHFVFSPESSAILIDGDVDKLILKSKMFVSAFYFRNLGFLSCYSMFDAYLKAGQPQMIISNAYVDIYGDTNTLTSYTHGNIGEIKVKFGIDSSAITAGAEHLRDVYTKDYSAVYTAYPPSGNIGVIKANIISGPGNKDVDWLPTTMIISASRPKLKIKPEQILTEGTSVYITQ